MSVAERVNDVVLEACNDAYEVGEAPEMLPEIVMFILAMLADKLSVCPLTPEQAQKAAREDSFWVRYQKQKVAKAASRQFDIEYDDAKDLTAIAVSVPANMDQDDWDGLHEEVDANVIYDEI